MKPRITKRTILAALWYHDKKRKRFVVYRRVGGVEKKTSVRYKGDGDQDTAASKAARLSDLIYAWPAETLAQFRFHA